MKKYNKLYPDKPLPNITPHVFQHTFCTDMHYKGLASKSLQYFMGYAKERTTKNIYIHSDYECAEVSLMRILKFQNKDGEEVVDKALRFGVIHYTLLHIYYTQIEVIYEEL